MFFKSLLKESHLLASYQRNYEYSNFGYLGVLMDEHDMKNL